MELKKFEEIVEDMVLQLSYPGLDPRTLNIALPMALTEAPVKLFVEAMQSNNVNVKLSALRWFQNKPGAAKNYITTMVDLLANLDPWVRKESIKAIGKTKLVHDKAITQICFLLKDKDQIVRIEAAKTLGNLAKELVKIDTNKQKQNFNYKSLQEIMIQSLQEATEDSVQEVRRKAIKALRKLGAFSAS